MYLKKIEQTYKKKYGLLAKNIPELIAVKFGLKDATSIDISHHCEFKKKYDIALNFCQKAGLRINYYEAAGEYKLIISKKKFELQKGEEIRDQNKNNWFSYPKCCIEKYRNEGQRNYLINGLKKFFEKKEIFNFKMNPFLANTPFHLFVHQPCSLECEKTLKYSQQLLNIIKQKNNELYNYIVLLNKTPAFYTDILGIGILFQGKKELNKIFYKNFYFEKQGSIAQSKYNTKEDLSYLKEIMQSIQQGDNLILKNNKLTIKKGNNNIAVFNKPEHLFWKIIEFI